MHTDPSTALDHLPFEHLFRQLREELGLAARVVGEIKGGRNNRLFRLTSENGPDLLAKFYVRDDRPRPATEFHAISFLRSCGFGIVPRALLWDEAQSYAVYSFEDGRVKSAAELTADEIAAIARFIFNLHQLSPQEVDVAFGLTPTASFSLAEIIRSIRSRLASFVDFAASPSAYPRARAFAQEIDLDRVISSLIDRAIADLTSAEVDARLPEEEWRLSTCDFGPHNVLVRPDGGICVVDLEYFGWDDPARSAMDFLCHDASTDLSRSMADLYWTTYRAARALSEAESRRFIRVRDLMDVEWLTTHLLHLSPALIERRRHSHPDFDLDRHLADQVTRFRHRLAKIEEAR